MSGRSAPPARSPPQGERSLRSIPVSSEANAINFKDTRDGNSCLSPTTISIASPDSSSSNTPSSLDSGNNCPASNVRRAASASSERLASPSPDANYSGLLPVFRRASSNSTYHHHSGAISSCGAGGSNGRRSNDVDAGGGSGVEDAPPSLLPPKLDAAAPLTDSAKASSRADHLSIRSASLYSCEEANSDEEEENDSLEEQLRSPPRQTLKPMSPPSSRQPTGGFSPHSSASASASPSAVPIDDTAFDTSPHAGGATEGSLGSSISIGSGSSGGNPSRPLNAAFTLSPRSCSEGDGGGDAAESTAAATAAAPTAPIIVLELDKLNPREQILFDFASIDERRQFVTQKATAAARKMSSARIIDNLLPALLVAFEWDDYSETFDDCASAIARALPDIIAAMGEDICVDTVAYFMGLLMQLSCCAEPAVLRDVTDALQRIITTAIVDDEVLAVLIMPFALSLRESFWSTPRAIAVGLLGALAARPAVVRASGVNIADWFAWYIDGCRDTCARVREAAVCALHQWVVVAQTHRIACVELPLPLVSEFITDDLSDTVRFLLVEDMLSVAHLLGREATSKYLQGTYVSACSDPSWRVRYVAAEHMAEFARLVANSEDFLRVVLALLAEDEESEIRSAVARQVAPLTHVLSQSATERYLVPLALHLGEDPNPKVRASAATSYPPLVLLHNERIAGAVCSGVARLMQDPIFSVQMGAINSLGDIVAGLQASINAADVAVATADGIKDDATAQPRRRPSTPLGRSSNVRSAYGSESASDEAGVRGEGLRTPAPPPPDASSRLDKRSSGTRLKKATDAAAATTGSGAALATTGSTEEGDTVVLSPIAVRKRSAAVVQALVAQLQVMLDAGNWRLRNAVAHVVRCFSEVLSQEQYEVLKEMLRSLLRDPVSEVRAQAVDSLAAIAHAYGAEWAAQTVAQLLQHEFAGSKQSSYTQRVMSVQCLAALLPDMRGLHPDDLRGRQLMNMTTQLMRQYARDGVPNVRIALARTLPAWREWMRCSVWGREVYNENVMVLQHDSDMDVSAAAVQAKLIDEGEVGRNDEENCVVYKENSSPF